MKGLPAFEDLAFNVARDEHKRFLTASWRGRDYIVRIPLHEYAKIEAGDQAIAGTYVKEMLLKIRKDFLTNPGVQNATKEREIKEGDLIEHQDRDGSRETTEASGSDCHEQSGQVKEKKEKITTPTTGVLILDSDVNFVNGIDLGCEIYSEPWVGVEVDASGKMPDGGPKFPYYNE